MRTALLAFLLIGCGGAAPVEPTTHNDAVETQPVADDGLDPIERRLDWSWRDGASCKPTLDDRDREFVTAYRELCATAMSRVAPCIHDAAFLATQPVDMAPVEDELDELVGTPPRVDAVCADLAADQFCGAQAGNFWDPYRAGELRTLATVTLGDCAATGAAFPRLMGRNGGD